MVQKIINNEGESLYCKEKTPITDIETGEVICKNCGVVLNEKISEKRKNPFFVSEKNSSHLGDRSSLTFHDMGLATVIGKSNNDFTGRRFSFDTKKSFARMRLWDARSQIKSSGDRNLRIALFEIIKLKEKLGLSEVIIERAAYIYRKAAKSNLVRGRSIKSMVGACVYVACREFDITRTIIDISNQLQESPKTIARSYRGLFHDLKLTLPVIDSLNEIIKISNNLNLPELTKREAVRIYDLLKEKGLTEGKNPRAVAAAVIYLSSIKTNFHLTQSDISKVSGITSVTIRNRLQDYKKYV